jgi:hypothetical protein
MGAKTVYTCCSCNRTLCSSVRIINLIYNNMMESVYLKKYSRFAFLGALFLCAVFVESALITGIPVANAITETVATSMSVSAESNIIEFYKYGQSVFVSFHVQIEPPSPNLTQNFCNLTAKLVRPNGLTIKISDFTQAHPNGTQQYTYNLGLLQPEAGIWTFKVSFSGQTFESGIIYYQPCEGQSRFTVLAPSPNPTQTSPPPASAVGSWTQKAPMNQARSHLGVAAVDGKIYAIGGDEMGTNEEYDPTTNTWTYKAKMPTPREDFATAVYQNKVYCIGGKTSGSITDVNEVYDPQQIVGKRRHLCQPWELLLPTLLTAKSI